MYSTVGSGDRDSAGQKAKTATTLFTLLKSTLPYVWTKVSFRQSTMCSLPTPTRPSWSFLGPT
jgi:hypothetical protein